MINRLHDVLRTAGVGVEDADSFAARVQNEAWRTWVSERRPFVILKLAQTLDKDIEPQVSGKYRFGDIRHCFADISLARELLGYEPQVALEDGMAELAEWLAGRTAVDRVEAAQDELARRGLRF